jgi:hypothetical protein
MNEMKTNVLIFLSCVSTILVALLLIVFLNKKENTPVSEFEKASYHKDIYIHQYLYESILNDNTSIVLPDNQNEMYPILKNLVDSSREKPVLVCRFSAFACKICVDYMIEMMSGHFEDYETNPQILFVASDYNPKMKLPIDHVINIT